MIFHKDKNGFHSVVKKIGRMVLIDEEAFFAWAKEQNELNKAKG